MNKAKVENRIKAMREMLELQYCPWQFDNWEKVIKNDKSWTQEEKDYVLSIVNERRNEVMGEQKPQEENKMTEERKRADEEVEMRKLARNFMKRVNEEGFAISLNGFDYLKDLASKAGSTKYTFKKGHPYFWFGNRVYVKC